PANRLVEELFHLPAELVRYLLLAALGNLADDVRRELGRIGEEVVDLAVEDLVGEFTCFLCFQLLPDVRVPARSERAGTLAPAQIAVATECFEFRVCARLLHCSSSAAPRGRAW